MAVGGSGAIAGAVLYWKWFANPGLHKFRNMDSQCVVAFHAGNGCDDCSEKVEGVGVGMKTNRDKYIAFWLHAVVFWFVLAITQGKFFYLVFVLGPIFLSWLIVANRSKSLFAKFVLIMTSLIWIVLITPMGITDVMSVGVMFGIGWIFYVENVLRLLIKGGGAPPDINPSTGLPMCGGAVDVSGTPYGAMRRL